MEFTLLAEGHAKVGATVAPDPERKSQAGSAVLFWDEPETNLNPKLYGVVIEVLLELQRLGVQIFLATHDYVVLKELDLRAKEGDKVAFPLAVPVGKNGGDRVPDFGQATLAIQPQRYRWTAFDKYL